MDKSAIPSQENWGAAIQSGAYVFCSWWRVEMAVLRCYIAIFESFREDYLRRRGLQGMAKDIRDLRLSLDFLYVDG
ncbi:hypothetical protein [Bacteroides acidifaciens]|uniref:hypothetical protein n=1 Tax=Bacteroides acidifaciens TaxID=85831 RepID=UPI003F68D1F7